MKYIISILLLFVSGLLMAKNLSDDVPNGRVLKNGDFILSKTAYSWEFRVLDDKTYKFNISKGQVSKDFTLSILNYEVFRVKFKDAVVALDSSLKDDISIFEEAAKVFITAQLNKEKIDDKEIIAGFVTVPRENIKVYYYEDALRINEDKSVTYKKTIDILKENSQQLIHKIERLHADSTKLKERGFSIDKQKDSIKVLINDLDNIGLAIEDLNKKIENLRINSANIDKRGFKQASQIYTGDFYTDSVTVEFFEGNLKNIIVYGEVRYIIVDYSSLNANQTKPASKKIILRNLYPIPFSSQRDLADLNIKLWEYPIVSDRISNRFDKDWYAYCSDIIKYTYALAINQEDYSPKDQVKTFKPGDNQPVYKEKSTRLFRIKVFSDFVGIKDDNPNGLVQFELSKRIIINPKKHPILANYKRANYFFGTFNFIEPTFNLSKIEENNKYLPLNPIRKDTSFIKVGQNIKSSASILELYRYQNFSAGFNLNIFTFDLPIAKSSIYLNGGLKLIRTAVSDSVRSWNKDGNINTSSTINKFNINSIIYSAEANYQLKSDTRFGFQATFRTSWVNVLNNNIISIYNPNLPEKIQYNNQRVISTAQLDAFIRPDISDENKGEIFARLSYNSLWFESKMNFLQVQIGYSFNLLKKE